MDMEAHFSSIEQEVTLEEWQKRKNFVDFTDEDVELLKEIHPISVEKADLIMDGLYEHFMKQKETRAFFPTSEELNRVKSLQKEYFLSLTKGEYGKPYLDNRLTIGRVHRKIGLEPRWYLGAYSIYIQLITPFIVSVYHQEPKKLQRIIPALIKILKLDQDLAMTAYFAPVEEAVIRQARELLEISTPIVEVWRGILLVPLIGSLDSSRTEQFMERLLNRIVETNSNIAVIDITGVPTIDSQTARHIIETITSVRLLGSQVILTGISSNIAKALVHLGIELTDVTTRSTLSSGLGYALSTLNLSITSKDNLT